MKKIEAIIRPADLESVCNALIAVGVEGMTVSEVKASDPRGRKTSYRGIIYEVSFELQYKIECVVWDARVPACVAAILQSVDPEKCNGTIVVLPVSGGIHIRTGQELDPETISPEHGHRAVVHVMPLQRDGLGSRR